LIVGRTRKIDSYISPTPPLFAGVQEMRNNANSMRRHAHRMYGQCYAWARITRSSATAEIRRYAVRGHSRSL